jgi:hypothetical protein
LIGNDKKRNTDKKIKQTSVTAYWVKKGRKYENCQRFENYRVLWKKSRVLFQNPRSPPLCIHLSGITGTAGKYWYNDFFTSLLARSIHKLKDKIPPPFYGDPLAKGVGQRRKRQPRTKFSP